MSLRKSIISGYVNQLIITIAWFAVIPVYIKTMGPEAYALVGLFSTVQLCFNFLDLGLTPTVAREASRYKSNSLSLVDFIKIYRAIILFFFIGGVVCTFLFLFLAPFFAEKWLSTKILTFDETTLSLRLMGIAVILRWMTGLYRGVITGLERLDWLNYFNIVISLFRFLGVLPIIFYLNNKPSSFFYYQVALAIIEVILMCMKSNSLLPSVGEERIGWSLKPLKVILPFTMMVALTSAIWVLVTQMDKVLVSGLISLEEYGYFSMAAAVASGVSLLITPVTSSIMPRMASLHALNDNLNVIKTYRDYTQLASIFLSSSTVTLVFCSTDFLFGWTGSLEIAAKISTVMVMYLIGNACFAMGYFPYFIQYAKGSLKYHLIGYILLFVTLMASIFILTKKYGLIGTAVAWCACNALYFIIWVSYTHFKIEKNLHVDWILKDIASIWLPTLILGFFLSLVLPHNLNRIESILLIGVFSIIMFFTSFLSSKVWRSVAVQNSRKLWEK